jgi:hypothetical protein
MPVGVYYYSGRAPASAASTSSAVAPGTRSQTLQLSLTPTYAPKSPLFGGQLALMLSVGVGSDATQVDAAAPSAATSQTVWGALDAVPAATLSWQSGPHSWMAYVTGNIPVGSYDPQRLSNVGIGHAALDAGGVYTFESAGSEPSFSAALGLTWNATNPDTDYRNGIDSHLGLSAMLPLSRAMRAGLSAYVYYQLTADSGGGDTCGACKSRVAGIGPQLDWNYEVAGQSWSLNLRGYYEFWARNRLEGYAVFATLAIPLGTDGN